MSLFLRGTNYGSVVAASGTLNFFGQGWDYHKLYKLLPGFGFTGATLITKTTTLAERPGNMPLNEDLEPKEIRPRCIYVNFAKGIALNAVGLSGPGANSLLNKGLWQSIEKPFIISFMSVAGSKEERLKELRAFCELLKANCFKSKFALEINISCPNTRHNPVHLIDESTEMVIAAQVILKTVPLIIKISVMIRPETIKRVAGNCPCDAIDVSNTIPFSQLGDSIDWESIFGSITSPLAEFGGGGLSGKPLLPLVVAWIDQARDCGITLPIIGGGGIFCKQDVEAMKAVGTEAISIGTVAMLRPWRVQGIIDYGNKIL